MATTDKTSPVSSLQSSREAPESPEDAPPSGGDDLGVPKSGQGAVQPVGIPPLPDAKPIPNSTRPQLVQLGSNSGQSSSVASHPKRFSAVNINKKFLEKNLSASGSTPVVQGSLATKPVGQNARSQAQPAPSYSRLVTTKLTSTSPASSTSGTGWSRPSSAAPPNHAGSHSPSNESQTLPTAASGYPSATLGVPQLPHAGKVIQPHPRTATVGQGISSKDTTGERPSKLVWGSMKPRTPLKSGVPHDFPTAAEVAQGVASNDAESRENSLALINQARMEEADTFRGVHLDPNAHHWDEMEEDDDNFLDGVIEFGDGRQYKIESTDLPASSLSSEPLSLDVKSTPAGIIPSEDSSALPVSKQERFLDDFDRSWPRSATSPSSKRDVPLPTGQPPSSLTTQGSRPPQETSRVLFNERSNRLEPYDDAQRSTSGQHRGYQETSTSVTESRNSRDILGTPLLRDNSQVLHKSGSSDPQSRFRKFSGASGGGHALSGTHNREREPATRWDSPLSSPLMPRDRDFHGDRGRRSDMAPPPLPSHSVRGHSRDGGRHPPHMSQVSAPLAGRPSPRDSRPQAHLPPILSAPNSMRLPPQSPASPHAPLSRISPALPATSLPLLSAPELDEVQKDLMQSAAARAKQRRQQEEEEREKEKERARRKAAELEERMKGEKVPQTPERRVDPNDIEVITIIEEAIKGVKPVEGPSIIALELPLKSKARVRAPSTSSTSPPASDHPVGQSTSAPTLATAMQADSWRNKAAPVLPPTPTQAFDSLETALPPPQTPTLGHMETFPEDREDLEIIEFSDMGKFVGAPAIPEPIDVKERLVNAGLHDGTLRSRGVSTSTSGVTWRQNLIDAQTHGPSEEALRYDLPKDQCHVDPHLSSSELSMTTSKDSSASMIVSSHSNGLKTLKNHKEAVISALDDAMSRIKGALDGMQAAETAKEMTSLSASDVETSTPKATSTSLQGAGRFTSMKERWTPPALRLPREPRENFDVTGMEPPRSPRPAWEYIVRLPTSSPYLEPVNRKQLSLFLKPTSQMRWDVLSFDPPVERMNCRDLSLNDVLFGKPPGGYRGKGKYRVSLPRSRTTFRMNISPKVSNVGAFGRLAGADSVTWRRSNPAGLQSICTLNSGATSSSPGVSQSEANSPSSSVKDFTPHQPDAPELPTRSRIQPRMPIGSSVAFYRDLRIDAVEEEPKSSVNFIVTSELESQDESIILAKTSTLVTTPEASDSTPNASTLSTHTMQVPDAAESPPPLIHGKTESKSSDDSTDPVVSTPPTHHAAPWARNPLNIQMKESPVRVPDPEHLKAVWSQTSNKAGLHAVNSLEGIADDLTGLPFTIQEVKSEDGETPPPSVSAAPSRMSLHDVTRAFQQVPTSSASTSSTSHRTPPIATPPMTRPSNYAYANTMRPTYAYPSPMMNHPHPTNAMYPMPASPIPSRMTVNGHTPLYSQPLWVSLSAPAPQNHGNMIRPMSSPYPAQLMPYPSPGTPGLYGTHSPQNMQSSSQQQPGAQINRDRSVPMMSPAMAHAGPAMYGSPVLMHAPLMQVPQNHAYMMPTNRPVRTENGQPVVHQHSQQSNNHEPPNYNPVAPFMRPTW